MMMLTGFSFVSAQWIKQKVDTTAAFRGLSVVSEKVVWASGTGVGFDATNVEPLQPLLAISGETVTLKLPAPATLAKASESAAHAMGMGIRGAMIAVSSVWGRSTPARSGD